MSSLYYRFEKNARDIFVEFLRRVYKYGGDWTNRELEIISVDDSHGELVFETFFEELEHYPIITVGTTGGQHVRMGFNDQIANLYDINYPLGTRAFDWVEFSTDSPFVFQVPTNTTGSISGFDSSMVWVIGDFTDDIFINVYQDYFSTGSILLASGSIKNFDATTIQNYFGGFYPDVDIQNNTDYWIEMIPQSGSIYKIAIDDTYTGSTYASISYSGSLPIGSPITGSIYGGLRLAPVMRMGGAQEFTLTVRCSMKNSLEKAQNLADLAEIYTNLFKHGVLSRLNTNQTKVDLSRFFVNEVPFLTAHGISIKNITKSGIENRKRGDNDIIFTIGLNIEVRTEWNVDFDEDTLKEIAVIGSITSF